MLVDFQAVAELGWIVGSGILLCAISCLIVMPAMLAITDRRLEGIKAPAPADTPVYPWLPFLARKPRWVIAGSLVVTLMLGYSAFKVTYDHNLLHLQARGLESVKWEMKLVERTAGASWHALSYTANQQEALALKSRFEKLPEVARVVEMASLIPLEQDKKQKQLLDVQKRLHNLPERGRTVPHDLPDPINLKAELLVLVGQLQPLADVSPEPLIHDLRRSLVALRDKIDEANPSRAQLRLQDFEQRMTADLIGDLYRLRDCSKPGAITLDDMPGDFRERYVSSNGNWLLRVFGRDSLWEFGPLEHFCKVIQSADPEATGKPFTTLEGLKGMRLGYLWAGLYALVAIVLVLAADFRKASFVLIALSALGHGAARDPRDHGVVPPAVESGQYDCVPAHHRRRRRQRGARAPRLPIASGHRPTLSLEPHDRHRHLRARSHHHSGFRPTHDLEAPRSLRPGPPSDVGRNLLHGLRTRIPAGGPPRGKQEAGP